MSRLAPTLPYWNVWNTLPFFFNNDDSLPLRRRCIENARAVHCSHACPTLLSLCVALGNVVPNEVKYATMPATNTKSST